MKEQVTQEMIHLMDEQDMSLETKLEILANILIKEGLSTIPSEHLPKEITPANLVSTLLNFPEDCKDTLGGAMIHQGLVMLMWLEDIKE